MSSSHSSHSSPSDPARAQSALRLADALSFSSVLAAVIGGALSLCASRLLEAPESARSALLVAAGAFIVYSLDRLRDTERDLRTSPLRTAFVETHRPVLIAATAFAGILLLLGLAAAEARTLALCAGIGGVGFFHRRLKGRAMRKTVYVSVAWTLGLIGLPVAAAPALIRTESAIGLALIFLATLFANLIASNLRDDETEVLREHPARALWIARLSALAGIAMALVWGLNAAAWIPLAEFLALTRFRPTERYGHHLVDGALLLGALATLAHSALAGPAG